MAHADASTTFASVFEASSLITTNGPPVTSEVLDTQIRNLKSRLDDDPNLIAKGEALLERFGAPISAQDYGAPKVKDWRRTDSVSANNLESWVNRTQESRLLSISKGAAEATYQKAQDEIDEALALPFRKLEKEHRERKLKLRDQEGSSSSKSLYEVENRRRLSSFGNVVEQANRKGNFGIASAFRDASNSSDPTISQAWLLLGELFGERPDIQGNSTSHQTSTTESDVALSHQDAARRFLEQRFNNHTLTTIQNHPRRADFTGVLNVLSRVKAYVRLQPSPDLEYDQFGNPVWAECYFLLRSGKKEEARKYLESPEDSRFLLSSPGNKSLANGLIKWTMDQPIEPSDRDIVIAQYHQLSRALERARTPPAPDPEYPSESPWSISRDPFKLVLLQIIGGIKGKPFRHDGLTEDVLWLGFVTGTHDDQLNSVIEESKSITSAYLAPLQFLYLLLVGAFDESIQFLSTFKQYNIETYHFAIVLQIHGKFRSFDIRAFTEEFVDTLAVKQPALAVEYLELISNSFEDGPEKYGMIVHFLARYGPFEVLVGRLTWDCVHLEGYLQKRFPKDVFRRILVGAAEECLRMLPYTTFTTELGDSLNKAATRFVNALVLYNLAEEWNAAQLLLEELLSDWLKARIEDRRVPREFLKVLVPRKPRIGFELLPQPVPPRVLTKDLRCKESKLDRPKGAGGNQSTPMVRVDHDREIKPLDKIQGYFAESIREGGDEDMTLPILVDLPCLTQCCLLFYEEHGIDIRPTLQGYLQVMTCLDSLELGSLDEADHILFECNRSPCPLWPAVHHKRAGITSGGDDSEGQFTRAVL